MNFGVDTVDNFQSKKMENDAAVSRKMGTDKFVGEFGLASPTADTRVRASEVAEQLASAKAAEQPRYFRTLLAQAAPAARRRLGAAASD